MSYGKSSTKQSCLACCLLWLATHMTTVSDTSTNNLAFSSTNSQRRGVLDQTLIIVTSDHGEGLGEHGLFDHGESLYRTEIRVPLLIVPPRVCNRRRSLTRPSAFVTCQPRSLTWWVRDKARRFPGIACEILGETSGRRASIAPGTILR